MLSHQSKPVTSKRHFVWFDATDGVSLLGSWFTPIPTGTAAAVLVNACGGGIPARMYRRVAQFLAGQGMAVLAFDYR